MIWYDMDIRHLGTSKADKLLDKKLCEKPKNKWESNINTDLRKTSFEQHWSGSG
jgi:hypothetical protein